MPSRSPDRGRPRTRSPYSDERPNSRSPSRPRRSISPRSESRTPRRNFRSESRSSRGRSPSPVRSTKVVIEKLTKNVTEEHLREIFGSYGQIRDLDMPMNRQFNTNRGTAYIMYTSEANAGAAIAHMHESQLDGCLINVSIVLPRRKFSPSPPLARHAVVNRGPPSANFRGPPPPRRRSPPPSYSRADRGERNLDTYRPTSRSRSRSPRRHRTRSRSISSRSRSRSRSPPRRRGGRRESPARGGGRRRRSPSYSSYSSHGDRSRSRSRNRGGRSGPIARR